MNSIYLLNNDLRLHDNEALTEACKSEQLIFVHLTPDESFSSYRKNFIYQCLLDFQNQLLKHDQKVYLINSISCLNEVNVDCVITSKVFHWPENQDLKKHCRENGIQLKTFSQSTMYKKQQLNFLNDSFPKSFSSFRRKVEKLSPEVSTVNCENFKLPKQFKVSTSFKPLKETLSLGEKNPNFTGGETNALDRLKHYIWSTNSIKTYKETRNGLVQFDDSSKLSPWLATGCLSARKVYEEIKRYEQQVVKNNSTYWLYFELLWRDYFKFYAEHYQSFLFQSQGPQQRELILSEDQEKKFNNWCLGKTSNDFINAHMLELKNTGWMSNRGRQNVANYLAKTLKVDWTWGAKWFEKYLIDYDVESNWGNWTYQAGVGSDSKDRIFNPARQAEMYDPNQEYQKLWLNKP